MPAVICNTSVLQYLHQIDRLDLLPALFGQVQIPDAVAAELDEGKRRNVSIPTLEDLSWVGIIYQLTRRSQAADILLAHTLYIIKIGRRE